MTTTDKPWTSCSGVWDYLVGVRFGLFKKHEVLRAVYNDLTNREPKFEKCAYAIWKEERSRSGTGITSGQLVYLSPLR